MYSHQIKIGKHFIVHMATTFAIAPHGGITLGWGLPWPFYTQKGSRGVRGVYRGQSIASTLCIVACYVAYLEPKEAQKGLTTATTSLPLPMFNLAHLKRIKRGLDLLSMDVGHKKCTTCVGTSYSYGVVWGPGADTLNSSYPPTPPPPCNASPWPLL